MNTFTIYNYSKIKPSLFIIPLFLLTLILLLLYSQDALSVAKYVEIQKIYFYSINYKLSQFPALIYNITQIGDALIFLSFLTLFIYYSPKIWETLISALIVSPVKRPKLSNLLNWVLKSLTGQNRLNASTCSDTFVS